MSILHPKPRRDPKIDLSGLTDRQMVVRQRVVALGEQAYGLRWQSDLAAALSKAASRKVGQAQISHWFSGIRPVPEAMIESLQRLAMRIADNLVRRAERIRADWSEDPPAEDIENTARA